MKKNKGNILTIIIGLIVVIALCVGGFFVIKHFTGIHVTLNSDMKFEITFDTKSNVKADETPVPENWSASVPIFMYHFILDDYGPYPDTENFLKPETLEEQLKYISENGYQTVFMNEFDKLYKYEKPVCLTFDDCFVYFYNNAFPLLKKYNQKATIYVITDYINGENYLTEEQIKEMDESGLVEIASHTCSHQYLNEMTREEQLHELKDSKERLEQIVGHEITNVAYPTGYNNDTTVEICNEYYEFGVEMLGGTYNSLIHTDKYRIPRIYANRTMPLGTYISYLEQARVRIN